MYAVWFLESELAPRVGQKASSENVIDHRIGQVELITLTNGE